MSKSYVGLDIGGTSVKMGVLDESGRLLFRTVSPSPLHDPETMAALCAELIRAHCPQACTLGVACAGRVDRAAGVVIASNLGWRRAPIARLLHERTGLPVVLDNDVQSALFGEWQSGACQNCSDVLYVSLGTGIGGALLLNGQPYRGFDNMGVEIGHLTTHADGEPCPCGRRGCFERYASAKALERMAGGADAREILARAQAGDPEMHALFECYLKELCTGLCGLYSLLHPQILIIGGGLSQTGAFLRDAVERGMRSMLMFGEAVPAVELAALQNDAGVIGAALMGRSAHLA